MKGVVSTRIVYMIAALVIAAVIFASIGSVTKKVLRENEYFETRLTLNGLRNNIIIASQFDSGRIIFTPVGDRDYQITIYDTYLTAEPEGGGMGPPPPPLPHYTPELVEAGSPPPYVVTAGKFCIVKQQDASCLPTVKVCADTDPCCTPTFNLCK